MKGINVREAIINLIPDVSNTSVVYMGWEDGDNFKQICKEEFGGLSIDIENQYSLLNKKLNFKNKIDLEKEIDRYQLIPVLKCISGSHELDYDMHIWSGNLYWMYNARYDKLKHKRLGIIGRIFKPALEPFGNYRTTNL